MQDAYSCCVGVDTYDLYDGPGPKSVAIKRDSR